MDWLTPADKVVEHEGCGGVFEDVGHHPRMQVDA